MRKVVAVVVGLVVAFIVVSGIEGISGALYPPPEDLDPTDREAMAEYVKTLPTPAFFIVLVAHAVGALAGAFTCAKIGRQFKSGGIAIGGLLLLGGIMNLMLIPHPAWFAVVDVLVYLPAAIVGVRLAVRGESGSSPAAPVEESP